ncbi:class I SAM-dependent methyltransferase [Roseinatronobacter sp.]|uniref:class I SAM-dependent methyltransferase n=1 Tax=Roseinatronobacter sp. TaxID=1945755 RepID=UPI0025CC16A9|nr:class I SAM-dependent methyltransferase [Roseibaca sp.]
MRATAVSVRKSEFSRGNRLANDFAYLDASHDCAATLKELTALSPLMAPDGIILGDDWQINPAHQHHGVFRAVQDYTRHEPWQIVAAGPGGQWALARR